MKKQAKKLVLSKETLRSLVERETVYAHGGDADTYWTCYSGCGEVCQNTFTPRFTTWC